MARVSTYLNFPQQAEEAFKFYRSVFKTEFGADGIRYFGDLPGNRKKSLADEQQQHVMHVELPITGGHVLMGTDAPESMGFKITVGNNVYLCIEPDTMEETRRLYQALSAGGKTIVPLDDMIWGACFGSCTDKFGINWIFNYH